MKDLNSIEKALDKKADKYFDKLEVDLIKAFENFYAESKLKGIQDAYSWKIGQNQESIGYTSMKNIVARIKRAMKNQHIEKIRDRLGKELVAKLDVLE